jgi:nucleotide-binding universal stress UspA family protein
MIQFKTILVTTDLSENANAAIPYAVALARAFGAKIRLLLVLEDNLYIPVDSAMLPPVQWMIHEHTEMEERLAKLAKELSAREGLAVETVVLHGQPHTEIIKQAQDHQADCIVMATHGRTGFSHLAFGSVAERVVRSSLCPVFTVRPVEKAAAHPPELAASAAR